MFSACACMGPAGDCPCIRKQKGLPIKITETFISADIFDLLSDDDKRTINDLKSKAFFKYMSANMAANDKEKNKSAIDS